MNYIKKVKFTFGQKSFSNLLFIGPGGSSNKALGYGLDGSGSIPGGVEGEDFSSLLRVQTGPGAHSALSKMSSGAFPGLNTADRRTSHLNSSWCLG